MLPLFDEKDKDLKPFITSKLYHILMTFNVMLNAGLDIKLLALIIHYLDTLFESAYQALLGNTLVYLFK